MYLSLAINNSCSTCRHALRSAPAAGNRSTQVAVITSTGSIHKCPESAGTDNNFEAQVPNLHMQVAIAVQQGNAEHAIMSALHEVCVPDVKACPSIVIDRMSLFLGRCCRPIVNQTDMGMFFAQDVYIEVALVSAQGRFPNPVHNLLQGLKRQGLTRLPCYSFLLGVYRDFMPG